MLDLLRTLVAAQPQDRAGVRLRAPALRPLLALDGAIGRHAVAVLGPRVRAVRAVLFDKTVTTNWALGWHQDRTICVRARCETAGYGPWTVKAGLNHVVPPFAVIERMLTLRVHLDAASADNAPLLIAPGSHRLGRLKVDDVPAAVARCGTAACLAEGGDVWLYRTPILHASHAAARPARRRVLQVDFSADHLPDGLEWLGI